MQREIVTRAEAKARGMRTYFTGTPCPNGNVAERRTTNYACMCGTCSAQNVARELARNRTPEGAERRRQTARRWYAENIEEQRARQRDYVREARKDDPGKFRGRVNEWARKNPHVSRAIGQKRRARKLCATTAWDAEFTDFVMREAASLAAHREECSGLPWHVDHMIPLQARNVSGLHVWNNLQVMPATLNVQKRNRLWLTEPGEWVRHV